ncbi:MAG: extracellular solute-binding protein [Firmicutes bacterium]|nr:extracellular solute-binding protein [Bacillota bacterium]
MKRTLLFVLSALLVLSLFAPAIYAEEKITLTVLNYFDLTAPNASREITEIWEEFERRNPHITIIREDLFNEPFHHKTEAYAAAGTLPDVIFMWPGGRSTTLHTKRLVKDLTPFIDEVRHEFSEAALMPQAGGYLAMIPTTLTASHVMYVNKGLLDSLGLEVPKTYEELVAMVPVLKNAGLDVVLMGAQDDWVIQSCLFSMIVGRLVGDEKMDEIIAGKAKFTDPEFMRALEFYKQLYDDGVLHRKIMNTTYGEVNGLFASGRAPFLIDGDWKTGNFLTDPDTGEALIPVDQQPNFIITVFPAIPGEINSNSTSTVAGVGYGMNANIPAGSAKEKAAWELIKWLNGKEAQTLRLETGGTTPSRVDVTSDNLEPLVQERLAFYGKVDVGTYVLDNVLAGDVYGPLNVGLQEIGLGLATPAEVAQRVQDAFDQWFAAQ